MDGHGDKELILFGRSCTGKKLKLPNVRVSRTLSLFLRAIDQD